MKIKSIEIETFGKLENIQFVPSEKLTVVYGENESGKSTLASFIKYMLYGFSRASKNVADSDKAKYISWSSEKTEGSMQIESSKKTYCLERANLNRAVSHIYSDGRNECFNGMSAGEAFLNVDEKTFLKTAFIGQNDITAANMEGLASAIQNIVFSLDEEINVEEAKKKLSAEKNLILNKGYKTGKLIELTERKEQLKKALSIYLNGHKELLNAEFSLTETQNRKSENMLILNNLKREYEDLQFYKAFLKLNEIEKLEEKKNKCENAYIATVEKSKFEGFLPPASFVDELQSALLKYEDSLSNLLELRAEYNTVKRDFENANGKNEKISNISAKFQGKDPNSVAREIMASVNSLKSKIKNLKMKIIIFSIFIITIPIALFMLPKYQKAKKEFSEYIHEFKCQSENEIFELINIEYQTFCNNNKELNFKKENLIEQISFGIEKNNISIKNLNSTLNKICCKLSNGENATIKVKEIIRKIRQNDEELKICENEKINALAEYETLIKEYDLDELRLKAQKYSKNQPQKDEKTFKSEIDFYERSIKALSEKERELEKKTSIFSANLPKPAEIESEICLVDKELIENNLKFSAMELAQKLIDEACEDVRRDIAPSLTQKATEIFSEITSEKYQKLYVNSQISLSFSEKETSISRDLGYLSGGAKDAAYLSLRLALTEYLYKEKPPIIFDDAFCSFDEVRLKNVLNFLCKLSEEYQIIIFTCQKRESELLAEKSKVIRL